PDMIGMLSPLFLLPFIEAIRHDDATCAVERSAEIWLLLGKRFHAGVDHRSHIGIGPGPARNEAPFHYFQTRAWIGDDGYHRLARRNVVPPGMLQFGRSLQVEKAQELSKIACKCESSAHDDARPALLKI